MSTDQRAVRKPQPALLPGIGSPDNPPLPKIDPEALKANNYPAPGIYSLEPGSYMDFSPVGVSMHNSNRQPVVSRIHAGDPIPALAAYQRMNKKSSGEFSTLYPAY